MNQRILFAGAALSLLMSASAQAEADLAKGKEAYVVCVACHGENGGGNQALNAPRQDMLPAWYLARQLMYFKEGVRGTDPKDMFGAQMRPMALTLADEQAIANVVAYMVTLTAEKPAATVKGDVAAGKAAYATCAACHGANGEGNEALNAPPLAGQHDWYVVRQLQNYKSGIRGANPKDPFGAQMRPMAMILADDAAINNVAAYIATLD